MDRDERKAREPPPSMSLQKRREDYGLTEAEEKTLQFKQMLEDRRNARKDSNFSRQELFSLREENHILKARCHKYEQLLETSGDPNLLQKFF